MTVQFGMTSLIFIFPGGGILARGGKSQGAPPLYETLLITYFVHEMTRFKIKQNSNYTKIGYMT